MCSDEGRRRVTTRLAHAAAAAAACCRRCRPMRGFLGPAASDQHFSALDGIRRLIRESCEVQKDVLQVLVPPLGLPRPADGLH